MAEGMKAVFDGEEVFIEVNNLKVIARREVSHEGEESGEVVDGNDGVVVKDIPLSEIRSVHVKNSEGYLLRLKLTEGEAVFSFDTHHCRDVIKSILLSYVKSEQEVLTRILECEPATRTMFNNVKQHVPASKFWEANRDKIRQMSCVVRQQGSREMDVEDRDVGGMLNPTLLKVFGQMNCSVAQFYNLLRQSYFSNIKNERNSVDRMISSVIRGYDAKQDFASRINSQSMMTLRTMERVEIPQSVKEGRKIEFLPIYPFETRGRSRTRREFEFSRGPLRCEIELQTEAVVDKTRFERRELEWIRDVSRVVYRTAQEEDRLFVDEIRSVTERFVEGIRKKYGDRKVEYVRRIIPTHFIRRQQ